MEGWSAIRSVLTGTRTESEGLWSSVCSICTKDTEDVVHCPDCAYGRLYCRDCCIVVHQKHLWHQPLAWKVSAFCFAFILGDYFESD